ncbi:MAG: glycosyltransferase 87 family protein [Myxococcales bacterium]
MSSSFPRAVFRFWPHLMVVVFFHLGYHRAQFSNEERQSLYDRFLQDPVGASLADPIAALRVHHVRDGDEYLYLSWANLMLGKPADVDFLHAESDATIPLLPFHAPASSGNRRLLPYRDFVFQYPPLAVVPIVLPALITTRPVLYPYAFGAFAGLAALTIAFVGWALRAHLPGHHRDAARHYLWMSAGALFLVGVTLETRLDVFAAAVVALSLWAAVNDRWILAGVLLGAGAAMKVYPALLFPAFLAPLIAQRRTRDALASVLAFLAAAFFACAAPALVSWSGFLHALELQSGRGLQVESVGATVVGWIEVLTGSPLETVRRSGARDVVGASAPWVASACRLLVPAMALLGALLPWWAARRQPDERSLPALLFDGVATAMAGIWIVSPVLSPQYLVWGLPVFFFASSSAARLLYLFALGVTRIEYPACYPFIAHLELSGLIVLTVRNGLLIATWVALLRSWIVSRGLDVCGAGGMLNASCSACSSSPPGSERWSRM